VTVLAELLESFKTQKLSYFLFQHSYGKNSTMFSYFLSQHSYGKNSTIGLYVPPPSLRYGEDCFAELVAQFGDVWDVIPEDVAAALETTWRTAQAQSCMVLDFDVT
jgi:hypothetical protein